MGWDRNVVAFRKRGAFQRRPKRARNVRRRIGPPAILGAVTAIALVGLAGAYLLEPKIGSITLPQVSGIHTATEAKAGKTVNVSWVDGDSGTIDGREFRLHGVDAPEGSPSKAKCAAERQQSAGAREAAQRATRGRQVRVRTTYGQDRYSRLLVDLSADGADVASALVASGHLRRWNVESGAPKPNWCR